MSISQMSGSRISSALHSQSLDKLFNCVIHSVCMAVSWEEILLCVAQFGVDRLANSIIDVGIVSTEC